MGQESGFYTTGKSNLVSLSGIPGVDHRGRQARAIYIIPAVTTSQVIDQNTHRIAMILQTTGLCDIQLGLGEPATAACIILRPGQSFQIDQNFPWTGSVQALAADTSGVLTGYELSTP